MINIHRKYELVVAYLAMCFCIIKTLLFSLLLVKTKVFRCTRCTFGKIPYNINVEYTRFLFDQLAFSQNIFNGHWTTVFLQALPINVESVLITILYSDSVVLTFITCNGIFNSSLQLSPPNR